MAKDVIYLYPPQVLPEVIKDPHPPPALPSERVVLKHLASDTTRCHNQPIFTDSQLVSATSHKITALSVLSCMC